MFENRDVGPLLLSSYRWENGGTVICPSQASMSGDRCMIVKECEQELLNYIAITRTYLVIH